jgi:hypothetical protein
LSKSESRSSDHANQCDLSQKYINKNVHEKTVMASNSDIKWKRTIAVPILQLLYGTRLGGVLKIFY